MFLLLGWALRLFPFDGPAYDAMADLWPFLALQLLFYAVFIRRATVGRIWALLKGHADGFAFFSPSNGGSP